MRDLRSELLPLVDQEPRSSLALVAALRDPSPRRVRVLTAGPGDRSRCVLVRASAGIWTAYPVFEPGEDVSELAAAIDRSAAVAVEGDAELVTELIPHLSRAGSTVVAPKSSVPFQTVEGLPEPDDSTRMATFFDLPQLVEVFSGYEIAFGRTMGSLRRSLADAVKRMWVVVSVDSEDTSRIDGAYVMGGFTPKYALWAHMSIPPEFRGRGRSWAMTMRAAHLHLGTGLGYIGVTADTNPMKTPPVDTDGILLHRDHLMTLDLTLPNRVPGEREVRRTIWKVDRKVRRSRPKRAGTFSRTAAGLDQEV